MVKSIKVIINVSLNINNNLNNWIKYSVETCATHHDNFTFYIVIDLKNIINFYAEKFICVRLVSHAIAILHMYMYEIVI